jgi:hypothetical protein
MNAKKARLVPGLAFLACLVFSAARPSAAVAQTVAAPAKEKPFVVEYYYKTRWGFADEFLRLFKKNHYPLLMKQRELGRILKVTAAKPVYHATEDGRWDYRVTIVWKNIQVTVDDFDEEGLIKQLYPDQETFRKEEQRRFEILLAHWDLPIEDVDLNK